MRKLRYAIRSIAKQPGFCISAILTLALGIGANTAMFSVFDAVILHPLPYRDSSRLVLVWQTLPDGARNPVSGVSYVSWLKQAHSFEPLLGIRMLFYNLRRSGEPRQVLGAQVSRDFFSGLGLEPIVGREFRIRDEQSDHDHVVVVSNGLWQREFGGDPHAVGATLTLNGESYTIIGVAPPHFDESLALRGIDVWTPLCLDETAALRSNTMAVLGRLKPGITIEQAGEEMRVVARRVAAEFPDLYSGWSAAVTPLAEYGTGKLRPAIAALMAAVGMVLLIACVNVANLLLARSDGRRKEVAIRAALGAGRSQLLEELLAETTLLAFAGSIVGVALAYGGLRLLIALHPTELPGLSNAALNFRVLAFTIGVTAITGLLFGLLPAREFLVGNLSRALAESGRSSSNSRRSRASRNVLVIFEIALSLVVLAGATMMARSELWLQNENRGFASDHLLTFSASFLRTDFPTASSMSAYYRALLDRLAMLPGVRAVAANTNLPLDDYVLTGQRFRIPGVIPLPSERPSVACNLVNDGYLRALGIPLLKGREFDSRDRADSAAVAIVSRSFARRYFPSQNPIGQKLIVPTPGRAATEVTREIVGVAGDVRYLTRSGAESLEIYLPYLQTTWPNIYVMMRTAGDASNLAPQLRAVLRDPAWSRVSIADLTTMENRISILNNKPRLNSKLAAAFAFIALLLAGVGIYGVVAYSTSRQAQEIGVRMALGATSSDIVRWILGRALLLTAAGIALGLAGYFALAHVLASLLYGVSAEDIISPLAPLLILSAIALLASYIPARRAVRGDPVAALRSQ